jgi:hypothetical protein
MRSRHVVASREGLKLASCWNGISEKLPANGKNMSIEAGKAYIFTKSGSTVRAIAPAAPYRSQACWTVEREDSGKQMTVPACALTALE